MSMMNTVQSAGKGRRSFGLGPAGLLLPILLLLVAKPGAAQYGRELQFLIFDPVALQVIETTDEADVATPRFRESGELPTQDPSRLGDWLAANTTASDNGRLNLNGDITGYERIIAELETNEGPFSAALPQQLLALGDVHQANGDLAQALEYFEQASHITRINHGLYSTEQVAAVERIIENHLLQGDLLAADQQHNYLLFLQQRNFGSDSAELLPALTRYAEWNMFAFTSGSIGNSANMLSSDEAIFKVERLLNAQHVYWYIVEILRKNFGLSDPRLLDAEMRLVLTNYLYATSYASRMDAYSLNEIDVNSSLAGSQLGAGSIGHMGYRHGRDALERRLAYLKEMPGAERKDIAAAALDLADWMLHFNRQRMQALETYSSLYEEFAAGLTPSEADHLFSPAYPVALPAFIPPNWSRASLGIPPEQALRYEGHIDVEFSLNRFGKVSRLQVLAKSEATPDIVEDRLIRSIRNTQFRPRLVDGQARDEDVVQARYYYTW